MSLTKKVNICEKLVSCRVMDLEVEDGVFLGCKGEWGEDRWLSVHVKLFRALQLQETKQ